MQAVLAKMRACKGCRNRYRMPEHKGEWKDLEMLVQSACGAPVPKMEIPSRASRLRMLGLASRRRRKPGKRTSGSKRIKRDSRARSDVPGAGGLGTRSR
jgi:hypothetical protein